MRIINSSSLTHVTPVPINSPPPIVSPRQISIYVKPYLWSQYMKSVVYHALRTMSENAYVKCRLWNCVVSILCPCRSLSMWQLMHFYSIHIKLNILHLDWSGILYDDSMMARQPHWQDPEGLDVIKTIIKKLILNWMNGLHAVQLELVAAILDRKSVLCCTATGDEKSAVFLYRFLCSWSITNTQRHM